ncbi:MAG: hypothetical protein C5B44_04295 [Acidobacteria bacterium]|nr:MAG: hypothetical protein C5B44_04295 [Acidobacteriota bacterium]
MRDKHIIDILETAPLAGLTEQDRATVEAHAKECADCRKAAEAAFLSSVLLKEHAFQTVSPPPFFETRVLAIVRERQATNDSWAFGGMWRAAGALVSSMAATVALLAVLTFGLPGDKTNTNSDVVSAANGYSAEEMMMTGLDQSDEQVSDAQVFTTLYDTEEEVAK